VTSTDVGGGDSLQPWGWDLNGASSEEEARKPSSRRRCAPVKQGTLYGEGTIEVCV